MININLTPVEELENPLWWIPDLIGFGVSAVFAFIAFQIYFGIIQTQVDDNNDRIAAFDRQSNLMRTDISQFNNLNEKISKLESKKTSLLRITESKLIRYLPVILLENLQNLKPDGLWFNRVSFVDVEKSGNENSEDNTVDNGTNLAEVSEGDFPVAIEVEGSSFSNTIIAEFMTSLKATKNQDADPSDVRTQLFFSQVDIELTELEQRVENGPEVKNFKLRLSFQERSGSAADPVNISKFMERFRGSKKAVVR